MVEKPATPKQAFSNFSILGRCVLPPEIFGLLETLPTGAGGEYQLTDAMKILAQTQGMIGVDFVGTRYDMGNKLGIMPVSYTHLDVYKRQEENIICFLLKIKPF